MCYLDICTLVGLASVGQDTVQHAAHCKTCCLLRKLDNQGRYPFGGEAVAATGSRVRSFVRGGEPLLRTRGMIGSRSVCGKAPMRQLHSNPIGKQINSFDAVIHMQQSPPHE